MWLFLPASNLLPSLTTPAPLRINTFSFKGEVFWQMSGVAMGTKMGPSHACLFMGHFEQKLLQHCKLVPEMYKRSIDNGTGATSMSHSQLLDFNEFVQNFHPPIKFTYELSEQSVAFLDMDISLKQKKLTTSVYYKATDSRSYLDHRSSHNPSTKNSIPSSRFQRLRRLCSDDTDFEEKAEQMVEFFIQRHYPEDIVREFCSSAGQNHSTSANSSAQQ